MLELRGLSQRLCLKKKSSPAGIFLQCCAVFSAIQAGAFHLPGYFFFFLDQAQWRPDRLSRLICRTVTWDQTWISCSQHVRYPLHQWCHTECSDENSNLSGLIKSGWQVLEETPLQNIRTRWHHMIVIHLQTKLLLFDIEG